jgi:FkbH-like protein
MKISDEQLSQLLTATSARDIRRQLAARRMVPSLAQANKLRQHIASLPQPLKAIRLGIVHTYTSELLDPWLHFSAASNQLALDIYHAPYGVTLQEANERSGLAAHAPDISLLLLTREDLHPALQSPVACVCPADRQDLLVRIQQSVNDLMGRFRDCVGGHIIVTLLPALESPGLGLYDAMAKNAESRWWSEVKAGVAGNLREQFSGVSFLDLDELVMQLGRDNFFDLRLWYSSQFPFSTEGALAVANAVTTLAASIHLTKAKVIVLDADNTLWGGILGEDGINGIALGPDYPGRVYVAFQKRLLCLQQRGFLLAMCSKNNPGDVEEVLNNHPHQVLKNQHFAAKRVNWLPKPDNLRSIAEELNLGLDSFIFFDDSDHECAAVRHSLPEVDVIQVSRRPAEVSNCLDGLARLEIVSLTAEDLEKTAMYAQERMRKSQLEQVTQTGGSIDAYLKSLNMKMAVGLNDSSLVTRLAQLTQKTNQFNLTTKRYSEQDIARMIKSDSHYVYHFSLADNFGDSGIVGLGIVERASAQSAVLDNFLMSCRVIGRLAEQAFLCTIVRHLTAAGVETLIADYIPTRKNILVENFLPENGFVKSDNGRYFNHISKHTLNLSADFPMTIEGPFLQ